MLLELVVTASFWLVVVRSRYAGMRSHFAMCWMFSINDSSPCRGSGFFVGVAQRT